MDIARRSRLVPGLALVPASVAAVLALWSVAGTVTVTDATLPAGPASAATPEAPGDAADLRLDTPDGAVSVTLDDTDAGRALAAALPFQVTLHGRMGQAWVGDLPDPVDVGGTPPVEDPTVDELYYWAPEAQLVVLTEGLGPVAPPQGLVRLGVVAER